jgi:hypothetical protein
MEGFIGQRSKSFGRTTTSKIRQQQQTRDHPIKDEKKDFILSKKSGNSDDEKHFK